MPAMNHGERSSGRWAQPHSCDQGDCEKGDGVLTVGCKGQQDAGKEPPARVGAFRNTQRDQCDEGPGRNLDRVRREARPEGHHLGRDGGNQCGERDREQTASELDGYQTCGIGCECGENGGYRA